MPEPRTAVMILVEASWEDQSGTLQTARACMENRSAGGACIRVKTRIGPESKLWIQSRWEEFSGIAKYCRSEGRDYLVGIQRDTTKRPIPKRVVPAEVPGREGARNSEARGAPAKAQSVSKREKSKPSEIRVDQRNMESEPIMRSASHATAIPPREVGHEIVIREIPPNAKPQDSDAFRWKELQTKQPIKGKEAGKERKHMARKWFELGHRSNNQEGLNSKGNSNGKGETGNCAPAVASFEVELLSMDDIYSAAGIMIPRRGYSINKVVEMLHSEHMRGLSREIRRAAVLMALDVAGIPVDEVLQDAKVRQDALDAYEAEQRKQVEAQWARKTEENIQIQAELERVKAQYMERIRRNLDGVAREKATFSSWLTTKQQEFQSMSEAAELCLKSTVSEPASGSLPAVSLADASATPV